MESIDDMVDFVIKNGRSILLLNLLLVIFTRNYTNVPYYSFIANLVFALIYRCSVFYNLPRNWRHISSSDIALITGGSNGLGLEIVKNLIAKGATVYVIDVSPPPIENDKLVFLRCDLSDEQRVTSVLSNLIEKLNSHQEHVSILINNAGIRDNKGLIDLEPARVKSMFSINTLLPIWILQTIINNHINVVLPKHPHSQLFVVTVSSILGTFAPKNLSIYSATKAASILIHEALMQELRDYQETIRLLLITTGQLSTAMFEDVEPSRLFLAPIVDHVKLAKSIVEKVDVGYLGCISEPFYANFLPGVRTVPQCIQDFCRYVSEIDKKIKDQ
ncbi:putative oxidoreductase TDA5 [Candida viswanathii]|uniref:Putative oxidoreductase TDA5 n=1 Tax=Candida viswanathii TaxID=5486 RepID=A0A367XZX2_9ASCO|nr:putative oxidoreductase TDA5 [Candida viswanathii]